jgi:hypothetical protein
VAKAKKTDNDPIITVEFPRTGISWIDAGIVGLERVLNRRPSYLKPVPLEFSQEKPACGPFSSVAVELRRDRLIVTGLQTEVQKCLERAYDCLIACYFNVSSAKQESDREKWNFYLDSKTEHFKTFPKRRAAGAALLLFDKAARPAGRQEKWGVSDKTGKPTPGILPARYAHLQSKLETLLARETMKAGPPAGLLVDAENKARPKVRIAVKASIGDTVDFLTGMPGAALGEAKNTAFPLFGGSRSFMNATCNGISIGWHLDYAGKFVPAASFFYSQGDDLFIFLPESPSLLKQAEVVNLLAAMLDVDPNLYRNFNLKLGGFFSGRSETTLAFLYSVFCELSRQNAGNVADSGDAKSSDNDEIIEIGNESHNDEDDVAGTESFISAEAVYNVSMRESPVNFAIVSARKKGNVWMGRDFWTFTDSFYLVRLFERMQATRKTSTGAHRPTCSAKGLMRALVNYEADKDKTLLRDKICEAVLHKHGVLDMLERHAFHLFGAWQPDRAATNGHVLDFAVLYEVERKRETLMSEKFEKMVQTACWLGDKIGRAAADKVLEKTEPLGRAKGNMFRLRKTRTMGAFVTEVARLQLRYRIDVPHDVLDGVTLCPESFEDFRGFCVIAALNQFQYHLSKSKLQDTKGGK